ncbi:hypothetical protein [Anaerobiospirillum succiniciproducens]|uniref:hypothetical protein n=1 Tax=Anaerobiospirillum succiniciproducens TaxID=13335 RepID=UPI003F8CB9D3
MIRAREQGGWLVLFGIEQHYFAQYSKDNTASCRVLQFTEQRCAALYYTTLYSTVLY